MKRLAVDVAIIGAGSAGMTAYRAALAHTDKVVVIESGDYGTTCARVGCMPSKLLIAAADAAHAVAGAGLFGIRVDGYAVDGKAVMRRVRDERDRFVRFVVDAVESWPARHKLHGRARFVAPHRLQVGDHTEVEAARVVIATGSSPVLPPGWRERLGDRLIVNDDVFSWQDLPRSVAVTGAGVIGLELSQALSRLGVQVRLLGRNGRIGPLTDPAVMEAAHAVFTGELGFSPDTTQVQAKREDNGVRVDYTENGIQYSEHVDFMLVAAGRRANLHDLDLQNAGLGLDEVGVPRVDRQTGRIGESHVFMAGDAGTDTPLLHEAADEGYLAGDNAGRYPQVQPHPRRAPLGIMFTDPQIAMVGVGHAALTDQGVRFETGFVDFEDQGRSRVMAQNRGRLAVYGEAGTGRFLGAEMIGPAAEHIGHLLAWALQQHQTVLQMLASPFYHPTVEEGLRTALRDLEKRLRPVMAMPDDCMGCTPGT
ncbi:dihydrolipoyl dehydrogenase [Noviherbaspirillum suwonense]|uniref:Dihydrolipoamide dehydrogenase n=1 Tax=Noviherbaspirillum suwonense TaxID=1224511 RepID=A0ABY1QCK5_9BURK|nr:dihydrolipoyl dehydrogenase [Noviherbaspirillum suwonense]SMP62447.1 dihydrolipoamide dehydrogenase [Noviherbaspirillum suwonense]